MPGFSPANDDNAIKSVTITLILDEFVEPVTIQEAGQTTEPWREGLPAVLPLPNTTIRAGGQEGEVQSLQLAIVRPDATPIWALKFQGFEISAECTAYTRWKPVSEQAIRYLIGAFDLTKKHQPNMNLLGVRMEVVDQFVSADDYNVSSVLKGDSFLGPRVCVTDGLPWHIHVGELRRTAKVYVFDLTSVRMATRKLPDSDPSAPYSITISHVQNANPPPSPSISITDLDPTIQEMHIANKARLSSILTDGMCEQIGLRL